MKETGTPARFYDRIAPVYDLIATRNIKAYRKIIERLNIVPGKSALEVGCGTGNLTIPLAETMAKVLAVDFAPKMLDRATRKLSARGFTNVTFRQDSAFDLTTAIHGTHHYVFTAFLLHIFPATDRLLLLSSMAKLATERVVVIDFARWKPHYAAVEWLERSHYKEFLQTNLAEQAAVAELELVDYFEQGDFGVWEFKRIQDTEDQNH